MLWGSPNWCMWRQHVESPHLRGCAWRPIWDLGSHRRQMLDMQVKVSWDFSSLQLSRDPWLMTLLCWCHRHIAETGPPFAPSHRIHEYDTIVVLYREFVWRYGGGGFYDALVLGSHRVGHNWSDVAAAAAAGLKYKSPASQSSKRVAPDKIASPELQKSLALSLISTSDTWFFPACQLTDTCSMSVSSLIIYKSRKLCFLIHSFL